MILRKQIEYTIWANWKWIRFIFDRNLTNEKLLLTASHILLSEQVWFDRIHGNIPAREIWSILSMNRLIPTLEQNIEEYQQILKLDLDKIVSYKRMHGEPTRSTIEDILLHLCIHGSHHRGQMAAIVSAMGLQPINTDYIQYTRNKS